MRFWSTVINAHTTWAEMGPLSPALNGVQPMLILIAGDRNRSRCAMHGCNISRSIFFLMCTFCSAFRSCFAVPQIRFANCDGKPYKLLPPQTVGLGLHRRLTDVCVCVCHRGHHKVLSRCRLVGSFVRPVEIFSPSAYDHVCTLDTVKGNLEVNSVFITIRSMRDTNKFHFFSFFQTLFIYNYCFPYHCDQKISWWRICRWRAVNFEIHLCLLVTAWALTSENASFGVCASRWSHQLTSDPKI